MISFLAAFQPNEQQLRTFQPTRPQDRPNGRLDIQRRHLEYKKMNYGQFVHEATVRDRANDIEQRLARCTMIAETRLVRIGVAASFRRTVGQAMISVGERIRPEHV